MVVLKKGVNDHEIGEIIDFALQQKCVRGVTFQPIQDAGRVENYDPERDRLTLSEVRQGILKQSPLFKPEDVIPVPCHPDCLAMAYALKLDGNVVPLTSLIDPQLLLSGEGNTIVYERNPQVRSEIFKAFSTAYCPPNSATMGAQAVAVLFADGAGAQRGGIWESVSDHHHAVSGSVEF